MIRSLKLYSFRILAALITILSCSLPAQAFYFVDWPRPVGGVSAVHCDGVAGFACIAGYGRRQVFVNIFIDGGLFATQFANQYHPEAAASCGFAEAGFNHGFGERLYDGGSHNIVVYLYDSQIGFVLIGNHTVGGCRRPTPIPPPTAVPPTPVPPTPVPPTPVPPTVTATVTPTPTATSFHVEPNGCASVKKTTGTPTAVDGYRMVFGYTNKELKESTASISKTNFMYIGCGNQPFDQNLDIRKIRNLRVNPNDSNSPFLGTRFLPGTRGNEVSVDITPEQKCATWCLGTKDGMPNGTPNCLVLSADPSLSSDPAGGPFCEDSRIQATTGEPAFSCLGSEQTTLAANIPAIILNGGNPTWKVVCEPGKNVTVDSSAPSTLRLSIPVNQAPAQCTVTLTATLGPISVTAQPRTVTLAEGAGGSALCASEPPTDQCGVKGGKNECVDCKGIPFGPNVEVPECGCVDPNNPGAITSCFACTSQDISSIKAVVDGELKALEAVINQMLNIEARLLGKKPKKHALLERSYAFNAQNSGWIVVWTRIDSNIYNCSAPSAGQVCTNIPAEEVSKAVNTIRCHGDNLFLQGTRIAERIKSEAKSGDYDKTASAKALSRLGSRIRNLKKYYDIQQEFIAKLPNTYVICSRENAKISITSELSCTPLS